MDLVMFDNGGTLIEDPFDVTLEIMIHDRSNDFVKYGIQDKKELKLFIDIWKEENLEFDFPFASHYLQERIFIERSLKRLNAEKGIPDIDMVENISDDILEMYRSIVVDVIRDQSQIPVYQDLFGWLKDEGNVVCIASNDRQFATETMMRWIGLDKYIDHIFTSEGISNGVNVIQKPQAEFFERIIDRLGMDVRDCSKVIMVGDSERNDIAPAKRMGMITVRYLNDRNPKDASWIDSSMRTVADHSYRDPEELKSLLSHISA